MTPNHNRPAPQRKSKSPVPAPRLRLKDKAPQTGYVDGAWWPHTDALPAELPDLLAVLAVRLGPIDRVLYNIGEWRIAPARLPFRGRAIRLDGYRHQPPHTVGILGLERTEITLLVVPADSDPGSAHAAMMAAATPAGASSVDDLLAITLRDKAIGASADQERWESDGGSPRRPTLAGLSGRSDRWPSVSDSTTV